MQILLVSTVKHPTMKQVMIDYVGGFQDKKLVYIPTAAHAEQGFGLYQSGGTYKAMKELSPDLETLELEFVTNQEAYDAVTSADILFMAGGFPVYLSYWLHRRGLRNLIYDRIKEGMSYIGTSAGAMVCSSALRAATFLDGDVFGNVVPGMGFIDYEIWPHYEDSHKEIIDANFGESQIKPLRDGEYILQDLL